MLFKIIAQDPSTKRKEVFTDYIINFILLNKVKMETSSFCDIHLYKISSSHERFGILATKKLQNVCDVPDSKSSGKMRPITMQNQIK